MFRRPPASLGIACACGDKGGVFRLLPTWVRRQTIRAGLRNSPITRSFRTPHHLGRIGIFYASSFRVIWVINPLSRCPLLSNRQQFVNVPHDGGEVFLCCHFIVRRVCSVQFAQSCLGAFSANPPMRHRAFLALLEADRMPVRSGVLAATHPSMPAIHPSASTAPHAGHGPKGEQSGCKQRFNCMRRHAARCSSVVRMLIAVVRTVSLAGGSLYSLTKGFDLFMPHYWMNFLPSATTIARGLDFSACPSVPKRVAAQPRQGGDRRG